jgi:hypothetical protein
MPGDTGVETARAACAADVDVRPGLEREFSAPADPGRPPMLEFKVKGI